MRGDSGHDAKRNQKGEHERSPAIAVPEARRALKGARATREHGGRMKVDPGSKGTDSEEVASPRRDRSTPSLVAGDDSRTRSAVAWLDSITATPPTLSVLVAGLMLLVGLLRALRAGAYPCGNTAPANCDSGWGGLPRLIKHHAVRWPAARARRDPEAAADR